MHVPKLPGCRCSSLALAPCWLQWLVLVTACCQIAVSARPNLFQLHSGLRVPWPILFQLHAAICMLIHNRGDSQLALRAEPPERPMNLSSLSPICLSPVSQLMSAPPPVSEGSSPGSVINRTVPIVTLWLSYPLAVDWCRALRSPMRLYG